MKGVGRIAAGSYRAGVARERSSIRAIPQLRRLLPYARRHLWTLIFAIGGTLATQLAFSYMPQLMSTAINSLTYDHIPPNYKWPAVGMLVIALTRSAIHLFARRALRRVSIAVCYDLRKRLFNHIQRQGPSFFGRFATGDLMSRAVNDVRMVRMAVSFGWVQIATLLFGLCTSLFWMLHMSPRLTAWVAVPLPFVALVGFVMSRGMYPYFREQQEAMARVTSFTQENLNGIRTIQAMAQEHHEIERFNQASTTYAKKFYRATRYREFMGVAMGSLTTISPLVILYYGGSLVMAGDLELGDYAAFSVYLMMLSNLVTQIGWSLTMFVGAAAGTERIFQVLDAVPEVADEPRGRTPDVVQGRLEFRAFSYRHPGAPRPTVGRIDLCARTGETVALLGRVGGGKSTILKAAVRLLNTPRGTVFLDGHDICDFPVRRLRQLIVLVPQDPFLFSASLRENLTYDDPTRDDEAIWDAVEAAGLGRTVREDLTDALDTLVGERGVTLSGGQKQRATLARGLVRHAKVLLLDDCFSSVDTETEENILSGLRRLRADKTTLLISHRVSTARHADRIYIIDNGHVLESGTHAELLAKGGYYAELEAVQSNQERDRSRKSALLHDLEGAAGAPRPAGAEA